MICEFRDEEGKISYRRRISYYAGFGCKTKEDRQRMLDNGWVADEFGGFTLYRPLSSEEVGRIEEVKRKIISFPEYYIGYIGEDRLSRKIDNPPCPYCMHNVNISGHPDSWICPNCGEKFPHSHYQELHDMFIRPSLEEEEHFHYMNNIWNDHSHNNTFWSEQIAEENKRYSGVLEKRDEYMSGKRARIKSLF